MTAYDERIWSPTLFSLKDYPQTNSIECTRSIVFFERHFSQQSFKSYISFKPV